PAGTLTNFGSLQTLYIPFVGTSSSAGTLGSVFGSTSFTGSYLAGQGRYPDSLVYREKVYNDHRPPEYSYEIYYGSQYADYYIPTTLKNVYVTNQTALRQCAFQNCTSIQNVYGYVNGSSSKAAWTSIGNATFDGCTSLTYGTGLYTFTSLTSVGIAAFRNCSNLKAKFTMKKVTYFGVMCFSGTQLNQLTLDTAKTYKTTGYGARNNWTFTTTANAANITISNATTNATNVKYTVYDWGEPSNVSGYTLYAIRQY
ncbi:MAG: leucine-rich repeat protein, partial [Clostridia bacterium]|nr:leucine-rich repeat protein [Clostridia bacterium]